MREIRQSGLEGGETNMLGLPYPIDPQRIWLHPVQTGNVWQWCDNKCDNQSDREFLRGGSWYSHARYCRSAYRGIPAPDYQFSSIGLRVSISQ